MSWYSCLSKYVGLSSIIIIFLLWRFFISYRLCGFCFSEMFLSHRRYVSGEFGEENNFVEKTDCFGSWSCCETLIFVPFFFLLTETAALDEGPGFATIVTSSWTLIESPMTTTSTSSPMLNNLWMIQHDAQWHEIFHYDWSYWSTLVVWLTESVGRKWTGCASFVAARFRRSLRL